MSDISFYNYCKRPVDYQYLPESTRKYYDHICSLQNSIDSDWKKNAAEIGSAIAQLPQNIISNMFTPKGLEVLSIFMGIDLTSRAAMNGILRGIAKGVGPEIMEAAASLAKTQGALFVNNSILTSVLASAVEDGSAAEIALMSTRAISTGATVVTSIISIVQILGNIIDSWDPEGYSQELNSDTMQVINDKFNEEFIDHFLSSVSIGKDRFGHEQHYKQWPVEYNASTMLAAQAQHGDERQKKLFLYITEYLGALEYNSDGEAMFPKQQGGELVNPAIFPELANSFELVVSNQNTVVLGWMKKHLVWIALISGVLLFLLIYR